MTEFGLHAQQVHYAKVRHNLMTAPHTTRPPKPKPRDYDPPAFKPKPVAQEVVIGRTMAIAIAQEIFLESIKQEDHLHIVPIVKIKRYICKAYGVDMRAMYSDRKTRVEVRPRQIAMYLARELGIMSLPQIGKHFGGRDHTTVLHAWRRVQNRIDTEPEFRAEMLKHIEALS